MVYMESVTPGWLGPLGGVCPMLTHSSAATVLSQVPVFWVPGTCLVGRELTVKEPVNLAPGQGA